MRRMMLVAGLGVAWAMPVCAQDGEVAAGREVAQRWCAECHVIDRNPATARDNVPDFPAIANRPNVTADALRTFLSEPHGRMPPLNLSRNTIDNAIAYILSLRAR